MKEIQTDTDLSSVRGYKPDPVNRRTKRNRELHKRNVLETAAQLFMERGYAGTSMADVAAALQIGRTSLYYYFESKEQILSSLVEEVTVSINATATSLTSMSGTPDQLLRELVRRHVEFIAQNGIIFRVLTNSQMYLTDELKEINDAAKNGIYRNFRKVIAQGVEDGTFRPIPPSVGAFTIIGMCNWVSSWFKSDKNLSVQEIGIVIADMAVDSVKANNTFESDKEIHSTLAEAKQAIDKLSTLLRAP